MSSKERVMVFLDGSNTFHALRRLGLKIDYYKLLNQLVGSRVLARAYYYSSTKVPQSETQAKFHRALSYEGFTVVTRPVKVIKDDLWIEKGVDLALVTDMLVNAFGNLFDTAILVSGDRDFAMALSEVKRLGKKVEVAAFKKTIGQELKEIADQYVALDDLYDKIHQ